MRKSVRSEMFKKEYSQATEGDAQWKKMPVPRGELFKWDLQSTYVREAPYFDDMTKTPERAETDYRRARAGSARRFGHHGSYLAGGCHREKRSGGALSEQQRCLPKDYNQYGARRGNHEVMMRGTFANIRLKNMLAPGTEGGVTVHCRIKSRCRSTMRPCSTKRKACR